MLGCIVAILSLSFAMGDFLPRDPQDWSDPLYDILTKHHWLSAFRREAVPGPPSTTTVTVHDLIRKTLQTAEKEGIKGDILKTAAEQVAAEVVTILSSEKPHLNLEKIRSDLNAVKADIMTLGSLNADLVLWDGLAYLLEHVTDPHDIHITLAAVKIVSEAISAEILDPHLTVRYTHVPYHRSEPRN